MLRTITEAGKIKSKEHLLLHFAVCHKQVFAHLLSVEPQAETKKKKKKELGSFPSLMIFSFLSSGDGCVGNFLSCRKGVNDPLEVPGVRCD